MHFPPPRVTVPCFTRVADGGAPAAPHTRAGLLGPHGVQFQGAQQRICVCVYTRIHTRVHPREPGTGPTRPGLDSHLVQLPPPAVVGSLSFASPSANWGEAHAVPATGCREC